MSRVPLTSPHRPTILQVLPALQAGGVERGTIEMTQAVARAGGRPIVASAGGRLVPMVERAGGTHVRLRLQSKDPLTILLNARRLARLIRDEKIDLVHARSRAPAWSAWLAARWTRTAFMTTWHGVYSENLPGKRHYNAVMARGARVIAISGYIATRIARDYRVRPAQLRIVPRGADTAVFDPELIRGDRVHKLVRDWRLAEDVPDDMRIVMLPGRITRWKGHAVLIDAIARMRARNVVCLFVGPGPTGRKSGRFPAELIAQAQRLGIGDRLRFAGHCEDMPAAFALADIVVVPSLKPEPFGRVVVEAQAMRRPVVVADHGAAVETVADGITGWAVPPGDADALAVCLDAILELPPETLEGVGETARTHVLTSYTTVAMQQATLAIYDELLGTALAEPLHVQDETAA